jgi:ferric-dicitrate binding protein FerR (iron transport regulator)
MENNKAKNLISKYLAGTCTSEEKAIVESWYVKEAANRSDELENPDYPLIEQEIWDRLQNQVNKQAPVRSLWPRIAAAASILIFLSAGGYFLLQKPAKTTQLVQVQPIKPGSNKAILTLASGKQIILNTAGNGQLAKEQDTKIEKTADGKVIYKAGGDQSAVMVYNTISTPQGGLYTLLLSDGTKVILNAASSLKYPVHFAGNERDVELTGEAYFEVAHNKAMPFKVKTTKQTVEVLGTHFNINSYTDESSTRTTLLEGKVKVTPNINVQSLGNEIYLIPGQQAVLNGSGKLRMLEVDTDMATDWVDGKFRCKNQNLESLMRKVGRWYDVQVIYLHDDDRLKTFSGTLNREDDILKLLKNIEFTGEVRFESAPRSHLF